jgi:hypothetical protein
METEGGVLETPAPVKLRTVGEIEASLAIVTLPFRAPAAVGA